MAKTHSYVWKKNLNVDPNVLHPSPNQQEPNADTSSGVLENPNQTFKVRVSDSSNVPHQEVQTGKGVLWSSEAPLVHIPC